MMNLSRLVVSTLQLLTLAIAIGEVNLSMPPGLSEASDQEQLPNPELEGTADHHNYHSSSRSISDGDNGFSITLQMPGALPKQDDSYLCTAFDAKSWRGRLPVFIKKFEVHTTATKVHHLIMSACTVPAGPVGQVWDCRHHSTCNSMSKILYAWAKDAPPADIPDETGFELNDEFSQLVMQIHYAHPLEQPDHARIDLLYTTRKPEYYGGIYLMHNSFFTLPPRMPKVHADISCRVTGLVAPLTVFAFRTHAHQHGTVISGYKYGHGNYSAIAKGDPQKPQAFYPVSKRTVIDNGDILVGRCTYSTMNEKNAISIGQTAGDEMCNLYLMYFSKAEGQDFQVCGGSFGSKITKNMPSDSDVPLTQEESDSLSYNNGDQDNKVMDAKTKKKFSLGNENGQNYYQVNNWPLPKTMEKLGQPCGVAIDVYGNPTVFHRGDRTWNANTFNWDNTYNEDRTKPIRQNTIVTMDHYGNITNSWGSNMFFMPHMITIDAENNVWVTDVALHQVFKFEPYGGKSKKPLIVLGKRFEPGTDDLHYCKPTSVAVMADGKSFFVADGYCNSRIMKYGLTIDNLGYHNVTKLFSWGKPNNGGVFVSQSPYSLNIPHGLTLAEDKALLCVADRENGRVQCYNTNDGHFVNSIQLPEFSSTIYSVDYNRQDGTLFALSGPEALGLLSGKSALGYKIDLEEGKLIQTFNAGGDGFQMPHDICVSKNGSEVFVVDLKPSNVFKLSLGTEELTNVVPQTNSEKLNDETLGGTGDVLKEFRKLVPSSNAGITIATASLTVTVLCSACIAFSKCRKRGKGKRIGKKDRKLDLGDLLGRSKDGFLPLNTNEDDVENISSDSDLEDFTVPATQAGV